jgi:hypothetical protein
MLTVELSIEGMTRHAAGKAEAKASGDEEKQGIDEKEPHLAQCEARLSPLSSLSFI